MNFHMPPGPASPAVNSSPLAYIIKYILYIPHPNLINN